MKTISEKHFQSLLDAARYCEDHMPNDNRRRLIVLALKQLIRKYGTTSGTKLRRGV